VQDQPVVRADAKGLRRFLVELFFDRERRLALLFDVLCLPTLNDLP
jgi:hypothetical protein